MSGRIRQEDYCLNCKTTLRGKYCHYCGQEKIDIHQDSFFHTLPHFVGDFIHFDAQIFKTAIPLLFKPGFLVNEYLDGRRVRYFHPIRMYIFLSFLFFFLTFSFTKFSAKNSIVNDREHVKFSIKDKGQSEKSNLSLSELSDSMRVLKDSITFMDVFNYGDVRQYDSVQRTLPGYKKDGWLKYQVKKRVLVVKEEIVSERRGEFLEKVYHHFVHNFPKILFILLPVFALLLKLLYRKHYYMDHLIFSIQFYNFFFLFGCIIFLLRFIPFINKAVDDAYLILPLLYLYVALLNVYKQRKAKTLLKFGLLYILFGICLCFGLFANALFTFFTF